MHTTILGIEAPFVPFMPQMVDRGGENELRDGMGDILLLLEFTGSPLKKLVPWLHWPSGSDFFIYGFPYSS